MLKWSAFGLELLHVLCQDPGNQSSDHTSCRNATDSTMASSELSISQALIDALVTWTETLARAKLVTAWCQCLQAADVRQPPVPGEAPPGTDLRHCKITFRSTVNGVSGWKPWTSCGKALVSTCGRLLCMWWNVSSRFVGPEGAATT